MSHNLHTQMAWPWRNTLATSGRNLMCWTLSDQPPPSIPQYFSTPYPRPQKACCLLFQPAEFKLSSASLPCYNSLEESIPRLFNLVWCTFCFDKPHSLSSKSKTSCDTSNCEELWEINHFLRFKSKYCWNELS